MKYMKRVIIIKKCQQMVLLRPVLSSARENRHNYSKVGPQDLVPSNKVPLTEIHKREIYERQRSFCLFEKLSMHAKSPNCVITERVLLKTDTLCTPQPPKQNLCERPPPLQKHHQCVIREEICIQQVQETNHWLQHRLEKRKLLI